MGTISVAEKAMLVTEKGTAGDESISVAGTASAFGYLLHTYDPTYYTLLALASFVHESSGTVLPYLSTVSVYISCRIVVFMNSLEFVLK